MGSKEELVGDKGKGNDKDKVKTPKRSARAGKRGLRPHEQRQLVVEATKKPD
jgi:hypothetical protein